MTDPAPGAPAGPGFDPHAVRHCGDLTPEALAALAPAARPRHDPAAVGLVAIDVDGTLTPFNDTVSPRVGAALEALHAAGVHVVIATGRSISGTLAPLAGLSLDGCWAVTNNGAVTGRLDRTAPSGFTITEAITFNAAPVLETVSAAYPEALFARERHVDGAGRGFAVTAPFPEGELWGDHVVVTAAELVSEPVVRLVVRTPRLSRSEVAALMTSLPLEGVSYDVGWSAWVDITASGVNKASALERLRRRLGVPREGTVAVGDGTNDASMLAWASRGVAMGNAGPEARAAASEIGPHLGDDGVAHLAESVLAGLGLATG
jgi:hydroxymethylpyrimidine pyrophosphatase-like HAD family hydrolase